MKKITPFFVAVAFAALFVSPSFAAETPDKRDWTAAMQAMFLSESGAHLRAAEIFAELAERLGDPELMREAYREAVHARDNSALRYVRRWRELGGGADSLQAEGRLLLLLGRGEEAAETLAEFKAGGADDESLFRILVSGRKEDALPLGLRLLDDSADGNFFRAKLAAHFRESETAYEFVARGLSQAAGEHPRLTALHLEKARIVSRRDGVAAAVALLDAYVAAGCPGGAIMPCAEAEAIYAYSLFAAGREEWKTQTGANDTESLFSAGRFFERAEMDSRARPYYEKVRGLFFHADLGLTRIARRAGNLREALTLIDTASVSDDGEFAVREATAAEITRDLHGIGAGLARIARAREVAPQNYELLYMHSLLAEESGDVAHAIRLLETLTVLFPDSADGWNALGYVLADHNLRLEEAERYIKKALSLDSESANILDSLGWVYYRQGRLTEALRYLQKAAAISESAEVLAHLGEVHWQLGEYDKARAAFAKGREYDAEDGVLNETLRRLQITE